MNNTNLRLDGLAITVSDPNPELKKVIESLGGSICNFSNDTVKYTPIIVIYCLIIALIWLCIVITICISSLRQVIDRLRQITNGFGRNREANVPYKSNKIDFQRVLPV